MRIIFFIGSLVNGGAEKVISILANEYIQNGWEVDIALLLKNEVNYEQFTLKKGIRIVDLSMSGNTYKSNAIQWLRSIRAYIKKEKPDRIVSFIGRINALVLTATFGMHIPIVISERNDPHHDGRSKAMLMYCNLIYHKASLIVFQTDYERRCFVKSLRRKSIVIPNPVCVEDTCGIEIQKNLISTAGRLAKQKNQIMLIDSIKMLIHKVPTIRCEIYGEGPEKQSLQQRIDDLQLNQYVYLAGQKTDIHNWIAKSQIFVLTSEFEGQSNALIEAMMLGKPAITTDYPGADEVIENNVSGLLVPCGDAEKLANAIQTLLVNEELYNRLSKGAQNKAQEYMSDIVLKKWEKAIWYLSK